MKTGPVAGAPLLAAAGVHGPAAGAINYDATTTSSGGDGRRWGQGSSRRVDPLRCLPDQLMELVIAYLPITDLGSIMAVAHHYRSLVPSFVTDLRCLAHHVPQVGYDPPSVVWSI